MCLSRILPSHCSRERQRRTGKIRPSDMNQHVWNFQQFSSGRGLWKSQSCFLQRYLVLQLIRTASSDKAPHNWSFIHKNCQRRHMAMLTPQLSARDKTEWNAWWVMTASASCQAVPHSQCCCLMLLWILAEEDIAATVTLDLLWNLWGHSSFQRSSNIHRAELILKTKFRTSFFSQYISIKVQWDVLCSMSICYSLWRWIMDDCWF